MADVKIRDAFGQATLYSNVNKIALLDESDQWHEFGGDGGGAAQGLINRTISVITENEIADAGFLGDYAFAYCTNLTSIQIPSSFDTIPDGCFLNCTSISSWSVPWSNITNIGNLAFLSCHLPSAIDMPLCETVGDNAFQYTNIQSIAIPSCTMIGASAFAGCSQLQYVSLGTETVIASYAFAGLSLLALYNKISNIYIPSSCQIDNGAFAYCPSLTSITFGADAYFCGVDELFVSTALTRFDFNDAPYSWFDIPEYKRCFYDCRHLSYVRFPTVGDGLNMTFFGCNSLTTIIFDDVYAVPKVDALTFAYVPSSCKVFVPPTWVASFQTADQWKLFDIQPIT